MTQPDDVVLPTFAVLARFRQAAPDGDSAVRAVVGALTAAEEPFHEVVVERQEDAATWMVVARFVVVSLDAHTAVAGVDEALRFAALTPDEVWSDGQLS
jgi:hypothetical protein